MFGVSASPPATLLLWRLIYAQAEGNLDSVSWLLVRIPEEKLSKGATDPRLNRVQSVPTDFYHYDSGFLHAEGSRA